MKKLLVVLIIIILVICLVSCDTVQEFLGFKQDDTPEPVQGMEVIAPGTPESAASELIDEVKDWNLGKVDDYLPDNVSVEDYVPEIFEDLLESVTAKLDYTVIDSQVNGDTAVVELQVTALDAESALNDAVKSALTYVAKQKLTGKDVGAADVGNYLLENVDVNSMSTTSAITTVHMVKDSTGEWVVDTENPDNMDFVNAMTGGTIEVAQSLKDTADSYGIDLSAILP